jgi:hypothetical protein
MRARAATRWLPVVLTALALLGALLEGASLPHRHAGTGLYNQEHDLTNLATVRAGAPVPDTGSALPIVLVAAPLLLALPRPSTAAPRRLADPRAPPSR